MPSQYTDKQRSDLVDLVVDGHATVPKAAARFGVAVSTAYQWLKQRRAKRGDVAVAGAMTDVVVAPAFARLVPSGAARGNLVVKVGGAEIQVRHGFDADLLRAVVATLLEGAK
jgi:transposase-like protein